MFIYFFIFLNGPRTCGYILDMSHKTELRYVLGQTLLSNPTLVILNCVKKNTNFDIDPKK